MGTFLGGVAVAFDLTRRKFLKISGAATVGATVALNLPDSFLLWAEEAGLVKATHVPTYCEICFWKCGAIAKVINGRVVKLEGNPAHPNSRGKLCARGSGGMGLLYDPDRIKTPLIREGKRGEGKYRKASWEEALTLVAEKMNKIRQKYGPQSMALFSHGCPTDHFLPLFSAFGSQNIGMPSFAQCRGPRDVGFELTFGENVGSPERVDMVNSKVVVLLGSHLGENMHNSQVQDFSEAVGRGAKFIVADPRFSIAAGKAHAWLPIRPGTDLALLLAWTNIIIKEGLYDKAYVHSYANGFRELAASVREYTPEWAEQETDIPAAQIIETARLIGKNAPAVCIHPGRHTTWYGDDVQRTRAIAILTAILGSWGRPGGIFIATKSTLPKLPAKPYPVTSAPPLNRGDFKFAGAEGVTQVIRTATITGKPYPIKGWFVSGTNLMKALPNQQATLDAINKLDLLVVVDVMPYDTAMLADVILPECSYLERHDTLVVGKGKMMSVSIRQPVVPPMYESKPAWWIAKELAKKVGAGEYFPWNTYEDKMKSQCALWGVNCEELKSKGVITFPDTAAPYFSTTNPPEFMTESTKIELYSKELKEAGFDPIPRYVKHPQPAAGQFRLLYGRSPVHTFSRTTNNPELNELYQENEVWVNSKQAKALGLKNGDYAVLVNQDGVKSNKVRVKATERIREDSVYLVHGFDTNSKELKRAYRRGADDQGLITQYAVDPICGGTGMRVNFVKLVKEA